MGLCSVHMLYNLLLCWVDGLCVRCVTYFSWFVFCSIEILLVRVKMMRNAFVVRCGLWDVGT